MAPAAPHWRRRGMLNRAMFVVRIWRALLIALLTALPGASGAFTVSIAAGTPTTIYLQVGVGTFSGGNYNAGGTPGNNTTINNETVAVAAGAVGNGVAQAMTTNSTTLTLRSLALPSQAVSLLNTFTNKKFAQAGNNGSSGSFPSSCGTVTTSVSNQPPMVVFER